MTISVLRVRTVFGGFGGAPGLMTQYFIATGLAFTNVQAAEASTRVKNALIQGAGLWPTAFTWTVSPIVDVLTDETGEITESMDGGGFTGTGSNATGWGPAPVGVLCRWSTATRIAGKSIHGQTFLVPVRDTNDGDGTPDTAMLTDARSFGTKMLDGGLTPTVKLVVWRRPRKANSGKLHNLPARPGAIADVISSSVADKFCILRSRRD